MLSCYVGGPPGAALWRHCAIIYLRYTGPKTESRGLLDSQTSRRADRQPGTPCILAISPTPLKTTLKVSVFMKSLRTASLQQQIALKTLMMVERLSTGWKVRGLNSRWCEIFRTRPDRP